MRVKVSLSLELSKEQVKLLSKEAKANGYASDGLKAPGKLIKRMLESKVKAIVDNCNPCKESGEN